MELYENGTALYENKFCICYIYILYILYTYVYIYTYISYCDRGKFRNFIALAEAN